ncbi:hypothetical protein FOMPIDRAFT_86371 [Fomitopsis schrenkii]|uniref:DUF6534 domain-containing protein n=1 Tax=Fomitopsis schrenkii TaxID=2126942 RepID=S8DS03_FOMSC|nr:hypothetical protein FOMPIDRAFT_86371 [Fomitopsis schrenkii]
MSEPTGIGKVLEAALDGTLGCLFLVGLFSVMILDTGKTIVDIACGWGLIILDHGAPVMLVEKLPAILPGDFVTSCSTIFIVQCCYLHSIWRFLKQSDHHQHVPFFMVAALSLACGSYVAIIQVHVDRSSVLHEVYADFLWVSTKSTIAQHLRRIRKCQTGAIRPASAAIVDIYITTWLCYHLHDSKTGHRQSDSMVTKLVNYALTRGMLTSVTQILGFILFLVDYPHNTLWFLLFYVPASTLYVNSLFSMWNSRRHVMWSNTPPTHPSGITLENQAD